MSDQLKQLKKEVEKLAPEVGKIIAKQKPSFMAIATVMQGALNASFRMQSVPIHMLENHITRVREIIAERKAKEEA